MYIYMYISRLLTQVSNRTDGVLTALEIKPQYRHPVPRSARAISFPFTTEGLRDAW